MRPLRLLRWSRIAVPLLVLASATALGCAASPAVSPAGAGAAPPAPAAAAPTAARLGGAATPAPAASAPAKVRLGLLGTSGDAQMYVALERGYFAQVGLDIEEETFQAGARMMVAGAAGQLDVLSGGPSAGLFNAIARGAEVRVVADKSADLSGRPSQGAVVARKELVESGRLNTYAGLKGLKISVLALQSANHLVIVKALQEGGLAPDDVELIELGVGDVNGAIANGAIDLGIQIEPLASIGEQRGLFRIWKRFQEIYPEHNTSVIMYSPQFVAEQPEAARNFMVAYLRGTRDLVDAFDKGKDKEAIVDILTRGTNVKDAATWDQIPPPSVNPDGHVIARTLAEDQDLYAEMGSVPTKVDMARVVDNSFVDYAIARLGLYQR
jgi:NitT/TauT family transport system substrate-binding protein